MHEFVLFGQVKTSDQRLVLQQLVGVTRMQPQHISELRLIFKARSPTGLGHVPSGGGSQEVVAPEVQRTRALLSASLFHVQLVGELPGTSSTSSNDFLKPSAQSSVNRDVSIANVDRKELVQQPKVTWRLEFRDIPDAGKHSVSTRLMSRTTFDKGDAVSFLLAFGYDYVSQYLVVGDKFYDQDTTLFLHRVLKVPQATNQRPADASSLPPLDKLSPLDTSGNFILQASIEVVDGNNPELKERATQQLVSMKETLKQSVSLIPGDRLALDTRVPVGLR